MQVIFDHKDPVHIDLKAFEGLDEGSVARRAVNDEARTLVDSLKPGELCVARAANINGIHTSYQPRLFRIGEKGLCVLPEGTLGIDIAPIENSASGLKEALVLKAEYGARFTSEPGYVSLSQPGIHYRESFNEGTFSPRPGEVFHLPHGKKMDAVFVGQDAIQEKYSQSVKEFELRASSIPFILSTEYFPQRPSKGRFNVEERVVVKLIDLLREEGVLETPMSWQEIRELTSKLDDMTPWNERSPQEREYFTRSDTQLRHSRKLNQEQYKLAESLVEPLKKETQRMIALNAVTSSFIHLQYNPRTTSEGYVVTETNADLGPNPEYLAGRVDSPKLVALPKRSMHLIPSPLQTNIVYVQALGKDKEQRTQSAQGIFNALVRFNNTYPSTKGSEDNYFPFSLL